MSSHVVTDVHDTISKTPDDTGDENVLDPEEEQLGITGAALTNTVSNTSTKDDDDATRVDGTKVNDSAAESTETNNSDPKEAKTAKVTSPTSGAAWGSVAVMAKANTTVVSPQKVQDNAEKNDNTNDIATSAAEDDASTETTTLEGILPTDAVGLVWKRLRSFAQAEGETGARSLFQRFDADRSGILDPKEFKAALAHVGLAGASNKVVEIVMKAASQRDGAKGSKKVLDYASFAVALHGGLENTEQPNTSTNAIAADEPALRQGRATNEAVSSAKPPVSADAVTEAAEVSVDNVAKPIDIVATTQSEESVDGELAGPRAANEGAVNDPLPEIQGAIAAENGAETQANEDGETTATSALEGGAGVQLEGMAPDDAVKVVWEKLQALIDGGNHGNALELFQTFDADKSGTLDTKEFKAALAAVGLPGASNKVATQVMKAASSGEHAKGTKKLLYYDDFLNALNSRKSLSEIKSPTSQGVAGVESQAEGSNKIDLQDRSLRAESNETEEVPAKDCTEKLLCRQEQDMQETLMTTAEEKPDGPDAKELPSDPAQGLEVPAEVRTEQKPDEAKVKEQPSTPDHGTQEPTVATIEETKGPGVTVPTSSNAEQGLEVPAEIRTEQKPDEAKVKEQPSSLNQDTHEPPLATIEETKGPGVTVPTSSNAEQGLEVPAEVRTEVLNDGIDESATGTTGEKVIESDTGATKSPTEEEEDEDIFGIFSPAPKDAAQRPALFAGSPSREELPNSLADLSLVSPPAIVKQLAPFESAEKDDVPAETTAPAPVNLSPPQTSELPSQESTGFIKTTPSPPLKAKPKTGLSIMRSAFAELVQRGDDSPASAGMASPLSSPTGHRSSSVPHHPPSPHHPSPSTHRAHGANTGDAATEALGSPLGDLAPPSSQAPAEDITSQSEASRSSTAPMVAAEAPTATVGEAAVAAAAVPDAQPPVSPPLSPSKGPASPAWGRVASPTKKNSTSGISPSQSPLSSPRGLATATSPTRSPVKSAHVATNPSGTAGTASAAASVVAAFKTASVAKSPATESNSTESSASSSPAKKLPAVKSGGVAARWAAARKAAEEERAAEEAAVNAAKAAEVVELARKAKLAAEATARARVEEEFRQKAQREAEAQASRKAMLEQATSQRKATEEAEARRMAEAAGIAKRAAAEERASLVKAGKEDAAKRQAVQDAAEKEEEEDEEKEKEAAVNSTAGTAVAPFGDNAIVTSTALSAGDVVTAAENQVKVTNIATTEVAKEEVEPEIEVVTLAPTISSAEALTPQDVTSLSTPVAIVTETNGAIAEGEANAGTEEEPTAGLPDEAKARDVENESMKAPNTASVTSNAEVDSNLNDATAGDISDTTTASSRQECSGTELHAAPETTETTNTPAGTAISESVHVEEQKDDGSAEIPSESVMTESEAEERLVYPEHAGIEGGEIVEPPTSVVGTAATTNLPALDAAVAEAEVEVEVATGEAETKAFEIREVGTDEFAEANVEETTAAAVETTDRAAGIGEVSEAATEISVRTAEVVEVASRARSTSLPAPPTPPRGKRRGSLDLGAPPPNFVPPLPKIVTDNSTTITGTIQEDDNSNETPSVRDLLALSPASLAKKASSNGGVTITEVMEALTGSAFLKLDLRARLAVLSPLPPSAFALDPALSHNNKDSAPSSADLPLGKSLSAELQRGILLADQASLLLALPLPIDRAACLLGLTTSAAAALALEFRLRGDYTGVVPLLGCSAATAVVAEINSDCDLFRALLPGSICQTLPKDTGARLFACRGPSDLAALLLALPAAAGTDIFAELVRRDSQVVRIMGESQNRSSGSSSKSEDCGCAVAVAVLSCAIRVDPSRAGALVTAVPSSGCRGSPQRANILMAALTAMNMSSEDESTTTATKTDPKTVFVSANRLANDEVAETAPLITRKDAIAAFLPEEDRAAFVALCEANSLNEPADSTPTLLTNDDQTNRHKSSGEKRKPRGLSLLDDSLENTEAAAHLRARLAKTDGLRRAAQEAVNGLLSAGGGFVCGPTGTWHQLAANARAIGRVAEEVRAQHVLAPGNLTCAAVAVSGSVVAWRFQVMPTTALDRSPTDDLHVDNVKDSSANEVTVPIEWVPTRIRSYDREEPLSNTTICSSISESTSRDGEGGVSDDNSDVAKSKAFFGGGNDDYLHGDEPSLDDLFDDDEDNDEDAVVTSRAHNRRGQSGIRSSLELDGDRNDGREGLDAVDWRFRREDSDDEAEDHANQSAPSELSLGAISSNDNSSRSRGSEGVEAWGAWEEDPTSPLDDNDDDVDSPTAHESEEEGREGGKASSSLIMAAAAPRRPPTEPPESRPIGKLAAAFAAVSNDQDDDYDDTSAAASSNNTDLEDNAGDDTTSATSNAGEKSGNKVISSNGENCEEESAGNTRVFAEALLGIELEKDWVEGLSTIDEGDDDDDNVEQSSPPSSSEPAVGGETSEVAAEAAAEAAAAGFEAALASRTHLSPVNLAAAAESSVVESTVPSSPDSPPRRLLGQALKFSPSHDPHTPTAYLTSTAAAVTEAKEDRQQSRGLSLDRRPLPSSPPQQNNVSSPEGRPSAESSEPIFPPLERRPSASELAVSAADAAIAEAAALEAYYAEQAEADDRAAAAAASDTTDTSEVG